jgi:hypothetical protein
MEPNKLFLLLLAVSCALGQVPGSGVSAYYPFNGNADDSMGHALNDGKLYSAAVTPYVSGRWGRGLALNLSANGSGSCDYVVVPNKSSWNLPRDTTAISVWYDADACVKENTRPQCILDCHGHSNTGMRREVMLYFTVPRDTSTGRGAVLSAQAIVSNDVDTQFVALACTLSYAGWHNAVVTWVKPVFSFYTDGVLVGRVTPNLAGAKLSTNNKTTYLGTDIWTASQCFCGLLDDVRLYNRSVSDSEIALIAAEGTPVAIPPRRREGRGFLMTVRKIPGSPVLMIETSFPTVGVEIYDVCGRRKGSLTPKDRSAREFIWDERAQNGTVAAQGIRVVRALSPSGETRAAVVIFTTATAGR